MEDGVLATENGCVRVSANVNKRKILVFAHAPPPHHGQSVEVQILLEGLRGEQNDLEIIRRGARSPSS
jgi:hypothetical protein